MVNIAFLYQEENATAMNMALEVLQSMAERGNGYVRACQSLLIKIDGTIKRRDLNGSANAESQVEARGQSQSDGILQSGHVTPGLLHDQTWDFDGDPILWAEVLESIDIDMDRQWVESTLRRGQEVESVESTI